MRFYDVETYHSDWTVAVYDTELSDWRVFHNDHAGFYEYWEGSAGEIWLGWNSRHFDRWVVKAILAFGKDNPSIAKEIADFIIVEDRKGWEFHNDLHKFPLNDYDIRQAVDKGLKTVEGFMGSTITETSVPFDIDRKLTPEEVEEVISYNKTDVLETMRIFSYRQDALKAHLGLLNWAGMDIKAVSKTPTQLVSTILRAEKVRPKLIWEEFDINLPDTLKLDKYQHIADWYLDPTNHRYKGKDGLKHQLVTDVSGVPHAFGYGGLHGAREQYSGEGYFLNMDVASLYPSLIIEYDLMSRGVPDPAKYAEIKNQRMEFKRANDPRSDSLKLALNSLYGALKDKYNAAYDPRQSNRVCVYGQLLLLDLIEKLETVPGLQVIQSNTDGVLVKLEHPDDYDLVDDVAAEWEARTRLDLEFEEYAKVYQRDVNTYVMVTHDGEAKSKGGWCKKLSDTDYDLAVVNKAITNRLVSGVPVSDTVRGSHDLIDFQLIASAGSKYRGLYYGDTLLAEKTVRAFASTRSSDRGLKKEHKNGTMTRIPSSPDNIFMVNDDIRWVKRDGYPVDLAWYINLAGERLKAFGVEG